MNVSMQGGTIAILCAMERPHFFAGIVLCAPAIMANPETATRCMVSTKHVIINLIITFYSVTSFKCTRVSQTKLTSQIAGYEQ